MSDTSDRWNARYGDGDDVVPPPARVLQYGASWLPESTSGETLQALDLACGRAGNGQWLAERGYRVTAWDISERVIEQIRQRRPAIIAQCEARDVSAQPPAAESFDIIVVARFLDRDLCPAIARALKPGGVLFYQTFTHGLSNPDYLLESNELLDLFDTLSILEYHEPEPDASGKAEAQLVARRS
ncbi:class I SAM-dependent methyltransferase [Granulosicoccus sp. 3-233]|uniref:class I SAM-dependent methyltransferase n=1 Tax=Granulosicoccus sp. 3-233 TaxID=3417969 RepID=UPI003D350227